MIGKFKQGLSKRLKSCSREIRNMFQSVNQPLAGETSDSLHQDFIPEQLTLKHLVATLKQSCVQW